MRTLFFFFRTAKCAFFVSMMICIEYVLKVDYAHDYPFELWTLFVCTHRSPLRRSAIASSQMMHKIDLLLRRLHNLWVRNNARCTVFFYFFACMYMLGSKCGGKVPTMVYLACSLMKLVSRLPSLLQLPKTLGSIDCLFIYNATTKTVKQR